MVTWDDTCQNKNNGFVLSSSNVTISTWMTHGCVKRFLSSVGCNQVAHANYTDHHSMDGESWGTMCSKTQEANCTVIINYERR